MAEVADFQERVASGDIPEDVAEITSGCKQLLRVNSRVTQTIAVCIARTHDPKKVDWWVEWCREELGLGNGNYRSKLAQAGRVLLSLTKNECDLPYYTRLFECDIMKIRELAPLPANQVAAFLSRFAIKKMTREKVRALVKEYKKRNGDIDNIQDVPAADKEISQPELPGFEEMVSGALAWEPDALVAEVRDADAADRSRQAGLLFLTAGLEYEKSREIPDVAALQEIKAELLSEVEDIEKVIAKAL